MSEFINAMSKSSTELNEFINKNKKFDYNQLLDNSEFWYRSCALSQEKINNIITLIQRTNIDVNKPYVDSYVLSPKTLYGYASYYKSFKMLEAIFHQGKCDNIEVSKKMTDVAFDQIFYLYCMKDSVAMLEKFISKNIDVNYNYNRYLDNTEQISFDICWNSFENIITLIEKTNIDVNKNFRRNVSGGTDTITLYEYARKFNNLELLRAILHQGKCNEVEVLKFINKIVNKNMEILESINCS
jgi:hypothetical protein